MTLLRINVPSCQIKVPPCQINFPLSNKYPKFLAQNHDPRDIYLHEGQKFVSLFDYVYGPLRMMQGYFDVVFSYTRTRRRRKGVINSNLFA